MDLLAFERKLDQTIMRKRLDIQEALKRPIKVFSLKLYSLLTNQLLFSKCFGFQVVFTILFMLMWVYFMMISLWKLFGYHVYIKKVLVPL